jgi:hypothetical protein
VKLPGCEVDLEVAETDNPGHFAASAYVPKGA